MTFEKWWAEKIEDGYGEVEMLLREAWESSAKEEREACAKVCEEISTQPPHGHHYERAAYAIRMRSNV